MTNGPGELHTWAYPVYRELRAQRPDLKVSFSLIPCQYASGREAEAAHGFGADAVSTPGEYLKLAATGSLPPQLGAESGFVLSLGGNTRMAIKLARALQYPVYSYKFVPHWDKRLRKLFVHDASALTKARRLGAPASRVEQVGNLVADALAGTEPAGNPGKPHIFLGAGTRDAFSIFLIPFMIGVVDRLGQRYPQARFVWPVSKLLSQDAVLAGIAGERAEVMAGAAGRLEGEQVITPSGVVIDTVPEQARYAHMRVSDLAVTIPGTNTLELGVAGVPSVVVLPMNKPEAIPLDGLGHWLGLIPLVGKYLKRYAVKLFVEGMKLPTSLPNRISGEPLMVEVTGQVSAAQVAEAASKLLANEADLVRRRARLLATMPQPGAAARLVGTILRDLENTTGGSA